MIYIAKEEYERNGESVIKASIISSKSTQDLMCFLGKIGRVNALSLSEDLGNIGNVIFVIRNTTPPADWNIENLLGLEKVRGLYEFMSHKEVLEKFGKGSDKEILEEPLTLSKKELDLTRQWFNNVQDTNTSYLTDDDYRLAEKIYNALNMRIAHSVLERR